MREITLGRIASALVLFWFLVCAADGTGRLTSPIPNVDQQAHQAAHGEEFEPASVSLFYRSFGLARSAAEFIDRNHDTVIAFAAVITAWFTATLWRATDEMKKATVELWKAGERQIDIAAKAATAAESAAQVAKDTLVAANRPWLKIAIRVGDQPLRFDENGANFAVAIAAENIGNAPGLHVSPHAWMLVYRNVPDADPFTVHQAKCEFFRQAGLQYDCTMFPGDRFPDIAGIGSWQLGLNIPYDQIAAAIAEAGDNYVSIFIGGCVSYGSPSDRSRHQTKFLQQLRTIDGGSAVQATDAIYQPGVLNLAPTMFGRGNEAD